MELWDVYNFNREKTGTTMVRGSAFKKGALHLVVHVCLFNSKGEMLIQQRQSFKDGWPNMWDLTSGGSAMVGDTSQSAAEREVYEELGIKLNLQGIRPNLTINFDHGFDDIYLIEHEVSLTDLRLQYEEVKDVRWAAKTDVLNMIATGEFIPYYSSLISFLFDSRCHYGCQRFIK